MTANPARLTVRPATVASLLSVIPHLLGFTPGKSLVVLGIQTPSGRVRVAFRYDLPDPPSPDVSGEIAAHAAAVLTGSELTMAVIAGYGPGRLVTPLADAARRVIPAAGIEIRDILRIEDGRYWSYLCTQPSCCPPRGVPFDPAADAPPGLTSGGGSPVPPGREALEAALAPLTGDQAAAMARHTRLAVRTAAAIVRRDGYYALAGTGLTAIQAAITGCREGILPDPGYPRAWLTVVLASLPVRDDAWARLDPAHHRAHERLFASLLRAARPGYAAAPACLLAFTAWQAGNGAIANIALDRADADNPRYSMARLLREAITAGLPPALAIPPITPAEVAASYARRRRRGDAPPPGTARH